MALPWRPSHQNSALFYLLAVHDYRTLAIMASLAMLLIVAVMIWVARRRARKICFLPHYWEHYGKESVGHACKDDPNFFHDAFPVPMEQRSGLQELMNGTCADRSKAFRLIRAIRVENSTLWVRYRRMLRKTLRNLDEKDACTRETKIQEVAGRMENEELLMFCSESLYPGEAYLWIGVTPDVALTVIHNSGDLSDLLGQTRIVDGKLCQEGWRLSDDFGKADSMAHSGADLYEDCYAMLLCRVVLGRQLFEDGEKSGSSDSGSESHEPTHSSASTFLGKAASPARTTPQGPVGSGRSRGGSGLPPPPLPPPEHSPDSRTSTPLARTTSVASRGTTTIASGSGGPFGSSFGLWDALRGKRIALQSGDSWVVPDSETGAAAYFVCNSAQVYPEFALIYDRCSTETLESGHDRPNYWDQTLAMLGASSYPGYWVNSALPSDATFFDMFPGMKFKGILQSLADNTWQNKRTRDRKRPDGQPIPRGDPHGDMPVGIRVLKAWRVEHAEMWRGYLATLQDMPRRRPDGCTDYQVRSYKELPWIARRRLDGSVNEVYLWHGSSPSAVRSIAIGGFDLALCGTNTGAMFGTGVYLAECSSKADEYSRDDGGGFYSGCFAMLLCRVVLGEAQVLEEADYRAHERVGPGQAFDSTVGDRESAVGTYREFVVSSRDQIYPEYAIVYERLYRTGPRLRGCKLEPGDGSSSDEG